MEPLDLDPGDYNGTYKLVGGRPVLDFINTVSWPETDLRHDWLSSPANVDKWCDALGMAVTPRTETDDLEEVRALRSDMADAIKPLAFDGIPDVSSIEVFNSRLRAAQEHRIVDPHTRSWTWEAPVTVLDRFAPIVLDAAELLDQGSSDRLRHCPSCDWLFEDQSRNGRRRWCDMADCGSRAKSRSYYQRTKTNPE